MTVPPEVPQERDVDLEFGTFFKASRSMAVTSDTAVNFGAYRYQNHHQAVWHIVNTHPANALQYEFFACIGSVNATRNSPAPEFNSQNYVSLTNGQRTLSADSSTAENLKDLGWAWVIIRVNRATPGANSSIAVHMRAE